MPVPRMSKATSRSRPASMASIEFHADVAEGMNCSRKRFALSLHGMNGAPARDQTMKVNRMPGIGAAAPAGRENPVAAGDESWQGRPVEGARQMFWDDKRNAAVIARQSDSGGKR